MDSKQKYAKADEFQQPKLIVHSALKREQASVLGVQFQDKKGFVNREVFIEKGTDQERFIDSTNWGMFKSFKEADLHPGDEAIVLSVLLQDPYDPARTYRHWVVQKVKAAEGAATPVVQVEVEPEPEF